MAKKEEIVLGSGEVYTKEFDGAMPEDLSTIAVEENRLGHISGGASLEYKPEYYTAQDDLGVKTKTVITKEEATLKSGVITWNGDTLAKLAATARVKTTEQKRTLKIGGVKNNNGKKYIILFVHKDAVDGDIYLAIVGRNEAGFTLAFAKDKESAIDVEFKAQPHDEDGTLIRFDEVFPVAKGKETAQTTDPASEAKTAQTTDPASEAETKKVN